MRRWVVSVGIGLVLLAGLAAAGLALAWFSPFLPGAPGYGPQRAAEQALLSLSAGPTRRAEYALDLFERRTAAVKRAVPPGQSEPALQALSLQLDAALDALEAVPGADTPALRARLVAALNRADTILQALPSSPQLTAQARRVEEIKRLAADRSIPLADLRGRTAQAALTPEPTAAPTATPAAPATVAPHAVQFPPGSAGAEHVFFPLTGRHAALDCATCHPGGTYAGTRDLCSACHAKDRPAEHYAAECDACHAFDGWLPANFNHAALDTNDCQTCHAANRPANHYPGQCSACHSTAAWLPAIFDHETAGATDCVSCHAANRPANHYNGQCSACHSTAAWLPATFNHQAAGAVDCAACHMGVRPANHFIGQCSMCHSTSTWAGAHFNHSFPMNHGGANGVCTNCHAYADGGPWSCLGCHSEGSLREEHDEDIASLASRCLSCHPGGSKGDDD